MMMMILSCPSYSRKRASQGRRCKLSSTADQVKSRSTAPETPTSPSSAGRPIIRPSIYPSIHPSITLVNANLFVGEKEVDVPASRAAVTSRASSCFLRVQVSPHLTAPHLILSHLISLTSCTNLNPAARRVCIPARAEAI